MYYSIDDAYSAALILGINFDKFSLEEFTDGINIELEHGLVNPKTNVTYKLFHGWEKKLLLCGVYTTIFTKLSFVIPSSLLKSNVNVEVVVFPPKEEPPKSIVLRNLQPEYV